MPEKRTVERARAAKRAGKAPSTQAGEFVREEIEHVREGKHGARSTKQAIAIGLSKARRAGVQAKPKKDASPEVRRKASRDLERGQEAPARPAPRRSRAVRAALQREGTEAASGEALAKQARSSARRRPPAERRAAAKRAARTKTPETRRDAARKAVAKRTPEARRTSAKKAAKRTPEARRAGAKKAAVKRTPEARRASAKKAAATRKKRRAAASADR